VTATTTGNATTLTFNYLKGVQGYQGYQGKSGVDGAQGIQGTTGLQGNKGLQGATGATGIQGKAGTNGTNGNNGVQGYQGITGPQGPSRFNSLNISVIPPDGTTTHALILMARGSVRGYKYISLTNAINPTTLFVDIGNDSNDIEHVALLQNNTNITFSFNNLNDFAFKYNNTSCPGLCPNDLGYFSLNRGEAVEISFMYNSEFGGIIVSLGNIYKRTE
ncbi:MAG: collagen-like protein, partial [Bacilli bacterium]|nr:collagen-like protein [Bacilli bacterium]